MIFHISQGHLNLRIQKSKNSPGCPGARHDSRTSQFFTRVTVDDGGHCGCSEHQRGSASIAECTICLLGSAGSTHVERCVDFARVSQAIKSPCLSIDRRLAVETETCILWSCWRPKNKRQPQLEQQTQLRLQLQIYQRQQRQLCWLPLAVCLLV